MTTTLTPMTAQEQLPGGLFVQPAPALPKGHQIKCSRCGCTVATTHVPGSWDCDDARTERTRSQSDWS